jgi:hypothetical protein
VTIALTPIGIIMSQIQESHERYAATSLLLASFEQQVLSKNMIEKRQMESTATEMHGLLEELSAMAHSSLAMFALSLLNSSRFTIVALS